MDDGCAAKLIGMIMTALGISLTIYGLSRPEQPFNVRAVVGCGVAVFLLGTALLNHIACRASGH